MERHYYTERITDKGYSIKQVCALMNRRDVRCTYNALYKAMSNTAKKSKREMFLTDEALSVLESLPDLRASENDLLNRMRENGISISDLWRYHNRTRERTYSYRTFWQAVRQPIQPFEIKARVEAERCLDELVPERKAGLS